MANILNAPTSITMYGRDNRMISAWVSWFSILTSLFQSGISTTQTFKDGAGATKTMTITNGLITKIE